MATRVIISQENGIISISKVEHSALIPLDIINVSALQVMDTIDAANRIAEYIHDALCTHSINPELHDENKRNQFYGTCFEGFDYLNKNETEVNQNEV